MTQQMDLLMFGLHKMSMDKRSKGLQTDQKWIFKADTYINNWKFKKKIYIYICLNIDR